MIDWCDVDCRGCGKGIKATGRAGRPYERCEACREKRFAFDVCHRCGSDLPQKRNKQKRFCGTRCKNSAWKAASRAARAA